MSGSEDLVQTTTSPEQVRDLYNECGGDLEQVAARLGLPYSEFVSKFGAEVAPASTPPARRRPPPSDLGHREGAPNPQYIVAVRHADNPMWPPEYDAAIAVARANYEAGTHEMVQGRDRGWFIQYSIPRKKRTETRRFFHSHIY